MSWKAIKDRFFTRMVYKNLPFIFFLGILGILYIANAHSSEKKMRKIQQMTVDLREYKWKYMAVKSDLMFSSTESEIARRVKPAGLQSAAKPPKRFGGKKKKKVTNE